MLSLILNLRSRTVLMFDCSYSALGSGTLENDLLQKSHSDISITDR